MATNFLRGRDQTRGAAGSVLDAICQNSLACSSWEAPLFCELTGHGLGPKEEMEFRWLESATLCPPGMPSGSTRKDRAAASGFSKHSQGRSHRAGVPLVSSSGLCHHSVGSSLGFPSVLHRKGHVTVPTAPTPRTAASVPSGQAPRSGWRPKALPPDPEALSQPQCLPPDHPPSLAGCCLLSASCFGKRSSLVPRLLPPSLAARASPSSRPHNKSLHTSCHGLLVDVPTALWTQLLKNGAALTPSAQHGTGQGGTHQWFAK